METLRGKLAEKTRELEKAEKTITMLRDAISRAEKDKVGLHNRLKRYCFNETIFNEQFTCDESLFLYSFLHSLLVAVLPKQWLVVRLWSQTKLYRTLNRTCTSWKKRYQNYYLQQLGFSNSPWNNAVNNMFLIKTRVPIWLLAMARIAWFCHFTWPMWGNMWEARGPHGKCARLWNEWSGFEP